MIMFIFLVKEVNSYLKVAKTDNLFLFKLSKVLTIVDFSFILPISAFYLDALIKHIFF